MKITKGTIVRTVMVAILIINMVLKNFGIKLIEAEYGSVLSAIDLLIEIGIIVCAWWYNNSFSKNALKAQQLLSDLNEENEYV